MRGEGTEGGKFVLCHRQKKEKSTPMRLAYFLVFLFYNF